MPAAATFTPIALNSAVWTLVADGAVYKTAAVQMGHAAHEIFLAIAPSIPAADSEDYIVLDLAKDKSFSIDLNTGDKLYARSSRGSARLRGYRVTI